MNAVSLLCGIIAQGGKVSASFYRSNPAFTGLMHHKFLRRSGVVASIVCDNCETPHAVEVVYQDEQYGYHCPDLGFVPVEEADVRAVQADLPRLVERLADTFDCTRRKLSPLHDQTWRIGVIGTELGGVSLYFQSRLECGEDALKLEHALSGEVQTQWKLIITAEGTFQIAGVRTVRLDNLLDFNAMSGAFIALARPADLVGIPRRNPGGAPNLYGKTLSELIRTRISDGTALEGRNAEARAVLSDFIQENPHTRPPSLSSVQDYVTKVRAGQ